MCIRDRTPDQSSDLHNRSATLAGNMVKQKNHTARNKTVKEHARGIKKARRPRHELYLHVARLALAGAELPLQIAQGH